MVNNQTRIDQNPTDERIGEPCSTEEMGMTRTRLELDRNRRADANRGDRAEPSRAQEKKNQTKQKWAK